MHHARIQAAATRFSTWRTSERVRHVAYEWTTQCRTHDEDIEFVGDASLEICIRQAVKIEAITNTFVVTYV